MKKLLLASVTLVWVAAAPALAANLETAAPVPFFKATPQPLYDWSGNNRLAGIRGRRSGISREIIGVQ